MSREACRDQSGMVTLLVHQAVTADSKGQTFLDVFTPPRRGTYLYGQGCQKGQWRAADLAACGLDTPTCSSPTLTSRLADPFLTADLCAAAHVEYPVTLAVWLCEHPPLQLPNNHPNLTLLPLTSDSVDKQHVHSAIMDFLDSPSMHDFDKVMVKPFGSAKISCNGVSYHDSHDVTSVLEAVLHLVTVLERGSGILVQSSHAALDPVKHPDFPHDQRGLHVKATVVRTPDNRAHATQVVWGGKEGSSQFLTLMNVDSAPRPLPRRAWSVRREEQDDVLWPALADSCERLMLELMTQEAGLTGEDRGGHGCQTDLLDIELTLRSGQEGVVSVVVGLDGGQGVQHPPLTAASVPVLLHVMLHRSQRFLMAGRTVLMVGAGGYSKRHLWTDAKELGVKLVLVESNPDHLARPLVDTFLHVDMTDHRQDADHAATIVRLLQEQLPDREMAGCLTWWEDCVPLAAFVGQALGLRHTPSVEAARSAKSKERTQNLLCEQQEVLPPYPLPPAVCASPVIRVDSQDQVVDAVNKIPLPAVMKLEFGASAVGVKHVHSVKEAVQHLQHVQQRMQREQDHPGVGLGHGQSLILMPRLQGTEHDVDVVLFEGQLMAAFVSDNGPSHLPLCRETVAAMPSLLHSEHKQQLMQAAASCCRGLGLHTGVFNVEMMVTSCGPRLIEVNARMGGLYLPPWIKLIYQVDLMHLTLMCACGVRPLLTRSSSLEEDAEEGRKEQMMGLMLYASRHGQALATTASPAVLQRLHQEGRIVFFQFETEVKDTDDPFDEPYGQLAVRASCPEEARTKLTTICTSLQLETHESMQQVLADFV